MKKEEKKIRVLYCGWAGTEAERITFLPVSGSYRKYFRLERQGTSVIGVFNEDRKENDAFISFSQKFHQHKLPVPLVHATDPSGQIYLLSDLGDLTLFNYLTGNRSGAEDFPEEVIDTYRKVIGFLPLFQVVAGKELDYSKCYPRQVFDSQ